MTDTPITPSPADIAPAAQKSPRLIGIDVMRFFVILPIIAVHCVGGFRYQIDTIGIIDNCGRFVVPFFFLVSGFFLGRRNPPTLLGIAGLTIRLLPVFLFWLIFYLTAMGAIGQLADPLFILKCLYYGGPAFHLWFLPALGMSCALVMVTRPLGFAWQTVIAIALYTIGLVTHPYDSILGLGKMPVLTETGPFFGFLFVLAGYYLGHKKWIPALRHGVMVLVIGMMMQMTEAYYIFVTGNGPFSPQSFLIGTIFLGIGGFIISLNIKPFPGSAVLAKLGQLVLGIYCVHPVFIFLFKPLFTYNTTADYLPLVTLVTICSIAVCLVLTQIPYLKQVVK